jgi:hypothetical protein
MEYKEENQAEETFVDLDKVNYINSVGEKWIDADCAASEDLEKCLKLKELSLNYGQDYMKLLYRIEKCTSETEKNVEGYEKCLKTVETVFNLTIDSYYNSFKKYEN